MIYARRLTVPHQQVKEVFTELGIDPGHYEILIQMELSSGMSGLLVLSEDSTATNLGPYLSTNAVSNGAGLTLTETRFITDKDRVYLYNGATSDDYTVAVALTAVP